MKKILPIIVVSQFFCTSLWFAGNAVITKLVAELNIPDNMIANISSAVLLGFILGTLIFAIFSVADRFSPSLVFFISSIFASLANIAVTFPSVDFSFVLFFRFLTGFFLAGIYPIGMKIAADYFQNGLGKSLGWLVGALVLGTAFPHLLNSLSFGYDWRMVFYATSTLSFIGGLAIYFGVNDGPYRKPNLSFTFSSFFQSFRKKKFRLSAAGYFGHMWELYAFWAFLPLILSYINETQNFKLNVSLCSFLLIASGSVSCVLGGFLAEKFSAQKMAAVFLGTSLLCCLASFFIFKSHNLYLILGFLLLWSMAVIADSPLFSTLVANSTEAKNRGSSLTIVNCLGFSITLVSIQLIKYLLGNNEINVVLAVLSLGPIVGLVSTLRNKA